MDRTVVRSLISAMGLLLVMSGMVGQVQARQQLVQMPPSKDSTIRTQLAYIESEVDAKGGFKYAYVAYTEEDQSDRTFAIKIDGYKTAGTKINPAHPAFIHKAAQTVKENKQFFIFGFQMKPRPHDPRAIEHRIYVNDQGQPTSLELYIVVRNANGSAKPPSVVSVPWPRQTRE